MHGITNYECDTIYFTLLIIFNTFPHSRIKIYACAMYNSKNNLHVSYELHILTTIPIEFDNVVLEKS